MPCCLLGGVLDDATSLVRFAIGSKDQCDRRGSLDLAWYLGHCDRRNWEYWLGSARIRFHCECRCRLTNCETRQGARSRPSWPSSPRLTVSCSGRSQTGAIRREPRPRVADAAVACRLSPPRHEPLHLPGLSHDGLDRRPRPQPSYRTCRRSLCARRHRSAKGTDLGATAEPPHNGRPPSTISVRWATPKNRA